MRGGSRSLLMLDQHTVPWVVKFHGNPQHPNIVINEFIATRIGRCMGLTIPCSEPIRVDERLTASIQNWIPNSEGIYTAGLQLGSQYAGGLMPGLVVDILPDARLSAITNLKEIAGVMVLDLWLANTDDRQAVYVRKNSSRKYRAFWIDFGHCLGGTAWNLDDHRVGYLASKWLAHSPCWEQYEPWIQVVEKFSSEWIKQIVEAVPAVWGAGQKKKLNTLANGLLARRRELRSLVAMCLANQNPPVERIFAPRTAFWQPLTSQAANQVCN
jgi:hypothetical protein